MNTFTFDMAAKSEWLNSNSILRLCKRNMLLKVMEIKSNEHRITQKQTSNQLGYSDSANERYWHDNNMDSPYKINKYKKKNNKSNTTISETHTTHGNTKNNKDTKNNKKNDLKGFFLKKNDHIEDNTKYITVARKMVENV